jgi:hypothetical protein
MWSKLQVPQHMLPDKQQRRPTGHLIGDLRWWWKNLIPEQKMSETSAEEDKKHHVITYNA